MDALISGGWRDALPAAFEAAALVLPVLATALIGMVQLAPRLLVSPEERPLDHGSRSRQVSR
jgi:hypothetical protein